jgi:predicted RNA binding protein YcfA (HicA-like mRNA interferase family)
MSRLPQITPRQMIAALQRAGFYVDRVKGSHHFLIHKDDSSRWATVAMHSGDLDPRDVRSILKQTRISREEFLKLL